MQVSIPPYAITEDVMFGCRDGIYSVSFMTLDGEVSFEFVQGDDGPDFGTMRWIFQRAADAVADAFDHWQQTNNSNKENTK